MSDDWWDSLSEKEQKQYIDQHPNSKYAKQGVSKKPDMDVPGNPLANGTPENKEDDVDKRIKIKIKKLTEKLNDKKDELEKAKKKQQRYAKDHEKYGDEDDKRMAEGMENRVHFLEKEAHAIERELNARKKEAEN